MPNIPAAANAIASANGGAVGFVHEHALEGFSMRIPAGRAHAAGGMTRASRTSRSTRSSKPTRRGARRRGARPDETTTTTVYDRLFVEVRNTSGTLLATLGTYSLNKMSYSQKSFSLASWRGQTVRIQFVRRRTLPCRRPSGSATSH